MEQHCCLKLLQATVFPAIRPSVYSRAAVASKMQLCNYLSYTRQLCCWQQLPTQSCFVYGPLNVYMYVCYMYFWGVEKQTGLVVCKINTSCQCDTLCV